MRAVTMSRTGKTLLVSIATIFACGCYVALKETKSSSPLDVTVSAVFLLSIAVMIGCTLSMIFRVVAATGILKGFSHMLNFLPEPDPVKANLDRQRRENLRNFEEATRRANYNAAVDFKVHHRDQK